MRAACRLIVHRARGIYTAAQPEMRKAALALSIVAAVPAAYVSVAELAGGLWRWLFGTMTVCAAGGPECHTSVAEPGDFMASLPYIVIFGVIALWSIAGGLLAMRRPWLGAAALLGVGVVGAGSILLFLLPIWTPFDLAAAGLAVAAATQKRTVGTAGMEGHPPT